MCFVGALEARNRARKSYYYMVASGQAFLSHLSSALRGIRARFEALARESRENLKRGLRGTGTTELPTD